MAAAGRETLSLREKPKQVPYEEIKYQLILYHINIDAQFGPLSSGRMQVEWIFVCFPRKVNHKY